MSLSDNPNMQEIVNLRQQIESARVQMKEAAKGMMKDGTAAIFAEYGDLIHSFGWTQYTPYFNDGDPCEFSMGELSIIGKQDLRDALEEEGIDPDGELDEWEVREIYSNNDWNYEGSKSFSTYRGKVAKTITEYTDDYRNSKEVPNPDYDDRYAEARQACEAVYNALDNDTARELFGDHVQVVITAGGVEVDEYEHD